MVFLCKISAISSWTEMLPEYATEMHGAGETALIGGIPWSSGLRAQKSRLQRTGVFV